MGLEVIGSHVSENQGLGAGPGAEITNQKSSNCTTSTVTKPEAAADIGALTDALVHKDPGRPLETLARTQ